MLIDDVQSSKEQGIQGVLEHFSAINYLVGPNGSGKSMTLSLIADKAEVSGQGVIRVPAFQGTNMGINYDDRPNLDPLNVGIENLSKDVDNMLTSRVDQKIISVDGPQTIEGDKKIIKIEKYQQIKVGDKESIQVRSDIIKRSYGESALIFLLSYLKGTPSNPDPKFFKARRVYLIDEPENGLNPEIQKKIPILLDDLVKDYAQKGIETQFFIATHSPFIISAASRYIDQRSYLLKDGCPVDLDQTYVEKSSGYQGRRGLNVVAEMLGAGFKDLSPLPRTSEEFTIVYCEGQNKDIKDSILYKKIFQDKNFIFISSFDLYKAVLAMKVGAQCASFIFGEKTKVVALVDRSFGCREKKCGATDEPEHNHVAYFGALSFEMTHPGKPIFTDDEREAIQNSDNLKRIRVLVRKEIENYLFDPAVIAYLPEEKREEIQFAQKPDYENGEVKDLIIYKGNKALIHGLLANIIYEQREQADIKPIYSELLDLIET